MILLDAILKADIIAGKRNDVTPVNKQRARCIMGLIGRDGGHCWLPRYCLHARASEVSGMWVEYQDQWTLAQFINMPNANCCVPHCHAWGRKHKTLKFYVIPKDKQQRKHWITRIRNENLTKNARVCSLHFVGGCKGYQEIPSIFPWTKEWEHVIENHNEMIVNTHAQNGSSLDKLPLLTLSRPKHSAKTPARRREHIRTSTPAKVTRTIITIFPTHQSFIYIKIW